MTHQPPEKLYKCHRDHGHAYTQVCCRYIQHDHGPCPYDMKPCIIWEYKLVGPMPEVAKGEGE